jgi:DNA ligase-associated metallophosphoesterase
MPDVAVTVAGMRLVTDHSGALWWPQERTLIVADLHLEKGSSFAARGQMLPPYDSAVTLAALAAVVERLRPRCVIALGDSFHDRRAAERLPPCARAAIIDLGRTVDLIWIAGNHDPEPPQGLPGQACAELAIGPVVFRHEPLAGPAPGEIAGHLHPVAKVVGQAGATRRRAFVSDGERLLMPAFGAYAGGLNLRDPVVERLFDPLRLRAYALGRGRIYKVGPARLRPD